mmetsp:Transcript_1967/g.6184  ORF Transcript_1967/g.6184 Transcript_1967/m.6184 type:complete len:585 (+) Transcript_1967:1274-3028(+)
MLVAATAAATPYASTAASAFSLGIAEDEDEQQEEQEGTLPSASGLTQSYSFSLGLIPAESIEDDSADFAAAADYDYDYDCNYDYDYAGATAPPPAPTVRSLRADDDRSRPRTEHAAFFRQGIVAREVPSHLTCQGCMCMYVEPRALLCMHVLCGECLQLAQDNTPESGLNCPLCGELTELDFNMLPKDLDLLRAVDKFVAGQAPPRPLPPLIASVEGRNASSSTSSIASSSSLPTAASTAAGAAIGIASASISTRTLTSSVIPIEDSRPAAAVVNLPTEKEKQAATDKVQAHSKGFFGTVGAKISALSNVFADEVDLHKLAGVTAKPNPDEAFAKFSVRPEVALKRLRSWAKERWFAPSEFVEKYNPGQMHACYIPFWSFSVATFTNYRCLALRKVEDEVSIAAGTEAKPQWVETTGSRESGESEYKDILLCATKTENLTKWEKQFSREDWRPSTAKYDLTEFPEQLWKEPAIEWSSLWQLHAEKVIKRQERKQCTKELERTGLKSKEMVVQVMYRNLTKQLVYLPIYLATYQYEGKDYAVSVHGQSGKVVGERPYGLGGLAKAGKMVGRGSMYLGRAVASKVL